MLLAFFVIALLAYVVVRLSEMKRTATPRAEESGVETRLAAAVRSE